jgi:hypothetical protein
MEEKDLRNSAEGQKSPSTISFASRTVVAL